MAARCATRSSTACVATPQAYRGACPLPPWPDFARACIASLFPRSTRPSWPGLPQRLAWPAALGGCPRAALCDNRLRRLGPKVTSAQLARTPSTEHASTAADPESSQATGRKLGARALVARPWPPLRSERGSERRDPLATKMREGACSLTPPDPQKHQFHRTPIFPSGPVSVVARPVSPRLLP